jgi:hypothetical protein
LHPGQYPKAHKARSQLPLENFVSLQKPEENVTVDQLTYLRAENLGGGKGEEHRKDIHALGRADLLARH